MQASPTCERYVRTYVTVPVRNKVSKATAIAWAKWRQAHPNWKPNPKVQRPRYKMTRKEQVEKVAFACQVPTDPVLLDTMFSPGDLHPPAPDLDVPGTETPVAPPVETAELTYPGDLPPVATTQPPYTEAEFPPPLTPPFLPPVFGIVPYPGPNVSTPPPNTPPPNTPPPDTPPPNLPPPPPPVAVLPEPSSWLLLGTAMALSPLFVRRRLRATAARRD